jgi:hypothetical protein
MQTLLGTPEPEAETGPWKNSARASRFFAGQGCIRSKHAYLSWDRSQSVAQITFSLWQSLGPASNCLARNLRWINAAAGIANENSSWLAHCN